MQIFHLTQQIQTLLEAALHLQRGGRNVADLVVQIALAVMMMKQQQQRQQRPKKATETPLQQRPLQRKLRRALAVVTQIPAQTATLQLKINAAEVGRQECLALMPVAIAALERTNQQASVDTGDSNTFE